MTDFRTLHEDNFLKDILDYINLPFPGTNRGNGGAIQRFASGARNFVLGTDSKKEFDSYSNEKKEHYIINGNIAKTSRALTAVFPVIVSKSVDIDKAVMISKAVERKCVGMLQMLFAANQISNAHSAKDYLRKFHNNISSSLDLSNIDIDDFLKYTEGLDEDCNLNYLKPAIDAINEDVRANIHYTVPTLTSRSLADMSVSLNEARFGNRERSVRYSNLNRITRNRDGELVYSRQNNQNSSLEYTDTNKPFSANDLKQSVEALSKSILDVDIKKANEAQPSLIIINFTTRENYQQFTNTCIIGVKAVIHYVDPQDIVNRVILKQSDSRGLFNLIRATTREISFFRDFLLAVDRAKVDAVARSGKGSTDKIWKLLELRADRLKACKNMRQGQVGNAAITTLVISKAEVDYIKQFHRIDLNKAGTVKGIMRGYNMMACAIIDEISERVDFLWDDGSGDFESLSFMSLEREESGSMYKKVINLAMRGR